VLRAAQIFTAALTLSAAAAASTPLPTDESGQPWFTAHCAKLGARTVARFPDVVTHRITYAWQSDKGYLWDWENDAPAAAAAHYCVRVALLGKHDRLIENDTFLCSVVDRGKPTETWTFGNIEIARRLCPLAEDALSAMDRGKGQR
jgi:hypothetical protein